MDSYESMRVLKGIDLNALGDFFHIALEFAIGIHQVAYRLTGVDNRGVIPTTEVHTNFLKRSLGELLGEVHGNLTSLNNFPFTGFGFKLLDGQGIKVRYQFLNVFDGDFAGSILHEVLHHLLSQIQINVFSIQGSLCQKRDQGTFQFPNIGVNVVRNIFNHFRTQLNTIFVHLVFENRNACLEVRYLKIR